MDIKRVDDKHMEIHKKEKSKLHQKDNRKISDKKLSIHAKDTVKGVGLAGGKTLASHVEGGEEIEESMFWGYTASKPFIRTARGVNEVVKKQHLSDGAKRIKKIEKGKKLARKKEIKKARDVVEKTAKKTVKTTVKRTSKLVAKETAKVAVETGATVAVTTAGTAVTGPAGPLIGIVTGETVGVSMDVKDAKRTSKIRMLKYFQDKLNGYSIAHDSFGKMIKDIFLTRISVVAKYAIKYLLILLLGIILLVSVVAIPVVAVIGILYNSPFSIFLPPLEAGDTVMSVTSAYMAGFNREIETLSNEHKDCDKGQVVYVNYEGTNYAPSNYYDVMCVYMVKYGFENMAAVMDDISKQNLKTVFDDMCTCTTTQTTEKVKDDDGKKKKVKILNVNVTLKNYRDMETTYSMTEDEIEVLEQMMSSDGLAQLGYTPTNGGGTGMSNAKSTMSAEEIKSITDKITDEKARLACAYALARVGYPYSQAYRDSGNYYDCSSLAFYSWQSAGVNISYKGTTTAAAEAQHCDENGKTVKENDLKPGDLIFYSYSNNGRYKNVSHVGIYVGNGKMVEAVDEKTGVVICDYHNKNMVLIGRPYKKK